MSRSLAFARKRKRRKRACGENTLGKYYEERDVWIRGACSYVVQPGYVAPAGRSVSLVTLHLVLLHMEKLLVYPLVCDRDRFIRHFFPIETFVSLSIALPRNYLTANNTMNRSKYRKIGRGVSHSRTECKIINIITLRAIESPGIHYVSAAMLSRRITQVV